MREQLEAWLKALGLRDDQFRFDDSVVIFCTKVYTYCLHFSDTYLGAQATSRMTRAGEDWHRGNDLPDGKFSHEVFDRIVRAIVAYEVVQLESVHQPVAVPE